MRYRLRFSADGAQPEESRDFDEADASFVFWLAETQSGREIDISTDAEPLCRIKRSSAHKDFWIISRPGRSSET